MADALPVLFVSHGAPTLVMEEIPARDFMAGLAGHLPRPRAILSVSAHWLARVPTVSRAQRPETIHDFYGFPDALYRLDYPAPGAPALADRVTALLGEAGLPAAADPTHGLDHGAWNPLLLIYPAADIPVAQLSLVAGAGPQEHVALGRALAPLRGEGVLILASGGAVHNLGQFRVDRHRPADWAVSFEAFLADGVAAGDVAGLAAYRSRPDGRLAHPTDEHLLPLFVALGAAAGDPGQAMHRSFAHGSLSMASFGWGLPQAA
ncbi:MAG: class III extradiol ring-cleavage dioxygenase [Dongiaceae bacterium]